MRDEDGVTVKATTLAALDAPEHAAVERKLREKAEKENLSVPEYDSKLWEEISGPRRKRWAV
ncbi:MAG TPA: hypothetical protein VMT56_00750 [Candidatus Bathyarchaeia archaeon]|nr:hypothetical protein [Candidatus Bathyarchaeia archaeon]